MKLSHHILQAISEIEDRLIKKVVDELFQKLNQSQQCQDSEDLLTDKQLCQNLQISISHFYKLKQRHKKSFPVYNFDGARRYKQSEVEDFFKQQE